MTSWATTLKTTRKGETLLEILIALFVLSTTSAAATFLIIQSSRTSLNIQKQFQARYLAREAFDYLKMIRNTNWIRFADKSCWATDFNQKDCSKQNPKEIADANWRDYTLVSGKPGDIYFHLLEKSDPAPTEMLFNNCKKFNDTKTSYEVYTNTTPGNYQGLMYSPDPVPPADQNPLFCRKISLKKVSPDAIQVRVKIAWQGLGIPEREYESYLFNY